MPRRTQRPKRLTVAGVIVFLLGTLGTAVDAQGLAVSVADFAYSGISEGEMKEYVDAFAHQLVKSVMEMEAGVGYPEGRVVRVSTAERAAVGPAASGDRTLAFAVLGSLSGTEDGYALAVSLEDQAGRRLAGLERTYHNDRQLYSDCIEVSRVLAQACFAEQGKVIESKPIFGGAIYIAAARALQPSDPEGARGVTYGLLGFIMPVSLHTGGSWSFGLELSVTDFETEFLPPVGLAHSYVFNSRLWAAWLSAASFGLDISYYVTPAQSTPCLGFSLGLLSPAPFTVFGVEPRLGVRWDLATGSPILAVQIAFSLGFTNRKP